MELILSVRESVPVPVRVVIFVLINLAVFGGFFLATDPIPQPPAYHNFADQRPLLGMPHLLNVASNLPFLIVGVWGLFFMAGQASRRPGCFVHPAERWPYWIFFLGLVLTAFGSAYYHAGPDNDTLVWDRASLTIAFMAFFTALLAERLSWRLAAWLLVPSLLTGVASVLYWHWTERQGCGDLRFYLAVQFAPLLAFPLLAALFTPRYTGSGNLTACFGCYVLAKILEILDGQIYTQGGLVSGHTLKHLVAGLGAYFILLMLQRRRPTGAGAFTFRET